MPDYNLYGLSTRSFEQLVQAIAASVIGPGTAVFGDGPDGGREATFEGKTQYPSSTSPWDGYVVIQAKFRQRPQSVEMDGAWALTQLSKELKKFTGKKRGLRRPEYYIFCTNVVLTPPDKVGAKDRANQLLGEFAKKLRMKGFALWDYDQLRTFIDDLPGVRHAYAAWITAGDVLAAVFRAVQWSRPDFESVMTNFLQKELLADQYVNLEQAGHAAEEKTPMARVFVDLPAGPQPAAEPPDEIATAKRPLPPGFLQDLMDAGAQRLGDGTSPSAPRDAQEGRPMVGRLVLVGGPGQGKTTISQFACQLHRASILSTRPPTVLSREVRTALDEIAAHCARGGAPTPICRRFPIRIILNHFAKELSQKEGARSVLSYIARRIKSRTDQDVTANDLRQWLETYPWLLILDGLDEVPPSSNRDDVLAAVQDFWVDVAERHADILVLATTRPQGYEEDFSPRFYNHRYLAPLSRARAMHYGTCLAAARYGNDRDREQRIVARLRRASAEEATARLMRSPLQVTIMATLVDQTGQPPRERWRLFHEYYEVIYKREMERDIPAANILREHKSNIDGIHSQVGLILQTESETVGQTDARLTSTAFGGVVAARLRQEGYEGKTLRSLEQRIIEAATHRLVFLVGMEADQVGFEIRSLQEFMAAEALTDETDALVSDRLNSIAPIAHWRNVFLFAAGKCFAVRQHLRDSVLAMCVTLNENTEDEISRRTFLGSQLALDLLIDGAAHQQPKFERGLARLAFKLADRPNTWLRDSLADAYQPSTEEVFREEMSIRLSGATAVNPRAWPILLSLADRGVDWAVNLADQYWPLEPARQTDILAEYVTPYLGRAVRSTWLKSKLLGLLPRVSISTIQELGLFWQELPRPAPVWSRALVQLFAGYQPNRNVRFSDFDLSVNRLKGAGHLSAWKALGEVPSSKGHPSWFTLSCVRDFAMTPDPAHLARTLRRVAAVWDEGTVRLLADCSPWPLAACLSSCRNGADADGLGRRAERAELGDEQIWFRAEDRWSREIRFQDVLVSDEHKGLPGPHLEEAGFCLGGARVMMVRDELNDAGPRLLELHSQVRTPSVKSAVARLVETIIIRSNAGPRVKILPWMNTANLTPIFSAPGGDFGLDSLAAIAEADGAEPGVVELLDLVGRNRNLWAGNRTISPKLYEKICRAWTERPHLEGLLPVLACWAAGAERCGFMVEALESHRCSEPRFGAASLVLQVAHGEPNAKQCDTLASRFAACITGGNTSELRLATALASKGRAKPTVVAEFLLALYRNLVPSGWEGQTLVMSGLDDIAGRRRSCLNEVQAQRRLKMDFLSAGGTMY
jgi:hypothetical protein